jgi:hypothetical protein
LPMMKLNSIDFDLKIKVDVEDGTKTRQLSNWRNASI